ncbi:MAG TPA: VOC family protein, partial [Puia sp.]|nr:VOC family protein [Puia sp.]
MENANQPDFGNGKICYLEIPSVNIDESAAFYHGIFGWKTRTDNQGNIAFDDGVGQVSGMWVMGREPSDEPGLLVYIMVDDVAKALDAVIAQGGKMVQPIGMDAPEVTARFSDPSGNVVGLYSQPTAENGKICYVQIPATDISSSSEF